MAIARDKFWMFGVRPHQDDIWLGRGDYKARSHRRRSRITPAEAAFILDIPNMMMICCEGDPRPYSPDAYGYMESFYRLDKVVWDACGDGLHFSDNDAKFVRSLAEEHSQVTGAFLDDLFGVGDLKKVENMLKTVREEIDKAPHPMELFVVWYPVTESGGKEKELLDKYADAITVWTWNPEDLRTLEGRMRDIAKMFPNKKIYQGVYLYNWEVGASVSEELMELQCELGIKLLKEKVTEGMIFETNSVMGVGLTSEKWLRPWIEKAKYIEIPD